MIKPTTGRKGRSKKPWSYESGRFGKMSQAIGCVPLKVRQDLDKIAKEQQRSTSNLVRLICEEYVKEWKMAKF